jgi:hypothetical protein
MNNTDVGLYIQVHSFNIIVRQFDAHLKQIMFNLIKISFLKD